MKRFTDSFDNGGIPFYNEDWNTAQKEPLKAAESIVAGLLEPCIISGGEITAITPTISIEKGYAFLNGKIMPFDAITNQPYGYLIEDTSVLPETRFLQDGGTANFSTESKAIYSATQPVSGDYIELNQQPYQYLNQVQFRQSTPTGSIIMLNSSTSKLFGYDINNTGGTGGTLGIGVGWYNGFALCNGNNGTDNLTDKFIKGTATAGNLKNTGGQATINLEHNHKTIRTGADDGTADGYDASGVLAAMFSPQGVSTTTLDATVSKNAFQDRDFYSDKQLSTTQNIEPPYYTLYYMQRI